MTAATLRRFFPALAGREITHAWGGPIDVAPQPPADLPLARGRCTPGWGFTGHGVGPSHLGGRILSGLALGVRDEITTLPLVAPPVEALPARARALARRLADPRGADPQGRRATSAASASTR